jgi:putative MATE family efflux protein
MESTAAAADSPLVRLPESRLDLLRVIWRLAWPVIVAFSLESMVSLVDTVMVGRLGAEALAGVGIGTQVFHAVSVTMIAVATGTVALVSRHIGGGRRLHAERVLLQSLYCAGAISVAAAIPIALWSTEIVLLFGVDAAVVSEGAAYLRYAMLAVPAEAIVLVIGSGLRGAGDMRTPLAVGALVNVVNVGANYTLIFGKLGFPALGVRGAALGTAIAFATGTLLSLAVVMRRSSVLRLPLRQLSPDWGIIRRVLDIGAPTAGEHILMQVGFMLYLVIAAQYGTTAVAAYFIGVRILALSFNPGFGFGAAASTLVGQNLGAQQPADAERSGWETTRLAVLFMSIGGILIFLGAHPIARLFIADPAVERDAVSFIRTLALAQPLMAADFTLGGALRGAGDTRFPLLTVIIGFYVARLGSAYIVASVLSLTLMWVWLALLWDYLARALLKYGRFQSGRWKTAFGKA